MLREFFNDPYSHYSSRLFSALASSTRNADLILTIRVYLKRIDPKGKNDTVRDVRGKNVPIVKWGNHWTGWGTRLKLAVEREWNNRLWLVPSGDWGCNRSSAGAAFLPNVKCGLKIQIVNVQQNAHLTINCVRPAAGKKHGSFMSPFQSQLAELDVTKTTQKSEGHRQVTAAHEFGHILLGPGHVACNRNAIECYGRSKHERGDMMGMGDRVGARHATPWLNRIKKHIVGKKYAAVTWTAVAKRPAPRKLSVSAPRPAPR